jgi:hypothetical protein
MFTHLEWRIPAFTLLFIAVASVVHARQMAGSFDELRFVVRPGDTVTVTDSSGRQAKGRLAHLSANSLALMTRDGERQFGQFDVRTVARRRHGNLGVGAIAGLVSGAALATVLATQGDCYCGPEVYVWMAGLLGGVGSGIGVAVSAMTWRNQVIFDRPSSPPMKVTVSPMIAPDRKGVRMAIDF